MRIRVGLLAASVVGSLALAAPAQADEVRTLSGPGSGGQDMFVTYVGCGDFFAAAAAPGSRLNLGPHTAPLGRRSLGLLPTGAGTASGPFTRFSSLANLGASVSAAATTGTQGVSWIWTTTPNTEPGTAWRGRADVTVPAGGWTQVSAAASTYTWTMVGLAGHQPVRDGGQATPAAFSAAHGDGPGYVVTGFGCDGNPFNIDAVRTGGVVYDFEGAVLSTAVSASDKAVQSGGIVTISGTVRDTAGRVTGDPLVLESRDPGGQWSPVGDPELGDPDGVTRLEVPVTGPTEFRWHRPESQYADEGWSDAVTVGTNGPPQ